MNHSYKQNGTYKCFEVKILKKKKKKKKKELTSLANPTEHL